MDRNKSRFVFPVISKIPYATRGVRRQLRSCLSPKITIGTALALVRNPVVCAEATAANQPLYLGPPYFQ